MEQILLCGNTKNYARGICQILLDTRQQTLSHLKQVIFMKDPRCLLFDKHNHLFVASFNDNNGGVSSYYVNDDYDELDNYFEEDTAPIALAIDHQHQLLFSLHHNGHLYVYSIKKDGTLYKEDHYIFPHTTSHMIVTLDHHLLVCDDKDPKMSLLSYNQYGKCIEHKTIHFEGIEGYQQLIFHPHHYYLYAISQRTHRLHIFTYNDTHIQEINTLNTLPQHQKGQCIQITLDNKGEVLYCLNRGCNTITIFHLDEDGKQATYMQSISSEGVAPHAMNLNASGQFLLVSNELSHNLTLFKTTNNGLLTLVSHDTEIPDLRQIITSEL